MIERLLSEHVWIAIGLGVTAYMTNYYLAVKEATLYYRGARDYIVFHDFYGPPVIPAKHSSVNMKLLAATSILAIGIGATWIICMQPSTPRPDVLSIIMGGLILAEIAAIMRRIRNIVLFRSAPNGKALVGKVEYSPRLVHTLFYVEMYSFAALYMLMFFTTNSWLFLGGALTCFVAGHRQRDWTVMRT